MQTLKTAIVVLLLMTVMYGSYVSLTQQPEPLPDAVASLIEESGSFDLGIDEGIPDSLVANDGPATDSFAGNEADPNDSGFPAFASPDGSATSGASDLSEVASLDAPPIPNDSLNTAVTDSLTDSTSPLGNTGNVLASPAGMSDLKLPKPNATASTPSIDPSRQYPTAGASSLELPDPNSLAPLPPSGWKKDATPVSFALPSNGGPDASMQLTDRSVESGGNTGLGMPGTPNDPPSFGSDPTASASVTDQAENLGLANAIRTADSQYAADQHAAALATLSLFYNTPGLSPSDREALLGRLDPLAASVIYSSNHLLEQPHRVGSNETLMEIAARYEVPWQLLANINQIDDPVAILPGTELKVVRGPFRAEVELGRNELTIFLGDLYAGRFSIAVGSEPAPQAGTYTIQDKQTARTFYDKNGSPVPPGDSRNPYGAVWMDLGKQLCIHGSPDAAKATNLGCISLRGDEAEDLYGILNQGSSITIRR